MSFETVCSAELKYLKVKFPFSIWILSISFKSKNNTPWICAAPTIKINYMLLHYIWFNYTRNLTSHLEFGSETVIFNLHLTHLVVNNYLDEGLDSKLEISSSKQNVSSDMFMNAGVVLKKWLNWHSINHALLMTSIVDVGYIMITQEGGEVLRVPDDIALSQDTSADF